MKKIGIMGGTFNPIHLGHLAIAQTAMEEMKLDRVLFIPNASPPHKEISKDEMSGEHRINMVKLAVEDNSNFKICTIESFGGKREYTVNTLRNLRALFPSDEFYFIAGSDALVGMSNWKSPGEIFAQCRVVVTHRAGESKSEFNRAAENLRNAYNAEIFVINMPPLDISSTQIRKKIAAGESVKHLVPDRVGKYISDEKLYV